MRSFLVHLLYLVLQGIVSIAVRPLILHSTTIHHPSSFCYPCLLYPQDFNFDANRDNTAQ